MSKLLILFLYVQLSWLNFSNANTDCNLENSNFLEDFFDRRYKWKGFSSYGEIYAEINFRSPEKSFFYVSDQTAPISNISVQQCKKITFKLKYDGANYPASLIRKEDQLVVSVGVPPITTKFNLKSL